MLVVDETYGIHIQAERRCEYPPTSALLLRRAVRCPMGMLHKYILLVIGAGAHPIPDIMIVLTGGPGLTPLRSIGHKPHHNAEYTDEDGRFCPPVEFRPKYDAFLAHRLLKTGRRGGKSV